MHVRMRVIPSCVAITFLLVAVTGGAQQPLVQGVNHTPIVVSDLEKAEADFRAMGFTIKPGHVHADGIRNAHVKFADETELELITAPKGVDDLTTEYRRKLERGEGPVYYGLSTSDLDQLLAKAQAANLPLKADDGLLTFPMGSPLHAIFFGRLDKVPTDRPEYFAHANTASRLSGFWVKDSEQLRDLFRVLNVPLTDAQPCGAFSGRITAAKLPNGRVYLVSRAGASDMLAARIDVRSISMAEATLRKGGFTSQKFACDKNSIWLPPSAAHGVWLEFTQSQH